MKRLRTIGRKRAGFTMIEVMVSLGVMTIGAMAIITLQQHTIRSNLHARQIALATELGEIWIARFQQDAQSWTRAADPNDPTAPTIPAALGGTTYLQSIVASPGVFQGIPNTAQGLSPAFTFQGVPANIGAGQNYTFCVSYRPTWVWTGRVIKLDVRVFWARRGIGANIVNDFPQCTDNNTSLSPGGPFFDRYHVVYLPTVIRPTPLIR